MPAPTEEASEPWEIRFFQTLRDKSSSNHRKTEESWMATTATIDLNCLWQPETSEASKALLWVREARGGWNTLRVSEAVKTNWEWCSQLSAAPGRWPLLTATACLTLSRGCHSPLITHPQSESWLEPLHLAFPAITKHEPYSVAPLNSVLQVTMWPEDPRQSGHLTCSESTDFHVNILVPNYA